MNCLSRVEIQELLDNEVSEIDKFRMENHLESCDSCRSLLESSLRDKELIIGLLRDLDVNNDVNQAGSRSQVSHKNMFYRLAIGLSAAAILAFTFIYFRPRKISDEFTVKEVMLFEYYNNKDLNKLWHEKIPAVDDDLYLIDANSIF